MFCSETNEVKSLFRLLEHYVWGFLSSGMWSRTLDTWPPTFWFQMGVLKCCLSEKLLSNLSHGDPKDSTNFPKEMSNTQYCAGDKIEKNEMGWACGAYGWGEWVYRMLVGKPEGRRPLGRHRRRWVDNIRIDLQEVRCGYMDWIRLVQDRDGWRALVSAVMNLRVPWNGGNFLTSCKPVSWSRRNLHHGVSK